MNETFDPYYEWLGIPAARRPPSYYDLLGLEPGDGHPEVIANLAEMRLTHLRKVKAPEHLDLAQRLLNEVAVARSCLLDPAAKARYDATLPPRVGPPQAAPQPDDDRSWLVGTSPGCQIVVASPQVSRLHCRLRRRGGRYQIEDLDSTNGTYVNGMRIDRPTAITPGDRVTLGAREPLPWPTDAGGAGGACLRIGRAEDNDVVLDHPTVSAYHAKLITAREGWLLDDLGSSNGTAVGSPEQRSSRHRLCGGETVFFGQLSVPAATLIARLEERRGGGPPGRSR